MKRAFDVLVAQSEDLPVLPTNDQVNDLNSRLKIFKKIQFSWIIFLGQR
jgi:hypothetical protein